MNISSTAFFSTALALACLHPVQSAQVDVARNSVKTGTSSIRAGRSLAPGSAVATGSNAKTQISLGGSGSLVRAGSKTEAVLENETDLSLRQGVMLASSGQRTVGREPVSVETPETKTTVKGTMLVAYQPKIYIKVTCVEGQATVKLKALVGEFVTLQAGEMVIINPAEKQLPQTVEVDLDELTRTSSLLGPGFPQLGSAQRLTRAVDRQAIDLNQGEALRSPLILAGAGLEVSLSNDRRGAALPERGEAPEPAPKSKLKRLLIAARQRIALQGGPGYVIDGSTQFSASPPSLHTPGFPAKRGVVSSQEATLWPFGTTNPNRTPDLLIRGKVNLPSTSGNVDEYVANGSLVVGDGGPTQVGTTERLILGGTQAVVVNSSRLATAAGSRSSLYLGADKNITILNSTIDQTDSVAAVASTIAVNNSTIHAGPDGLQVLATGQGAGISVTNSSQLQSLAGFLSLQTQGSSITIRNSQIEGREVLIDTILSSTATPDGLVEIRNSVINGDSIRARAFRSGGDRDALVISGSTFNATNMIKFYAEGASKLRFQGDVNLNLSLSSAGKAILAGRTVQVDNGGAVNIKGSVDVYRDVDNYNKPGFGRIDATGQQSHQSFNSRPAFDGGPGL